MSGPFLVHKSNVDLVEVGPGADLQPWPVFYCIFGAPSLQPDSKEISRTQQRCSERQLSSSSGASHWARIEPVNVRKKNVEIAFMFPVEVLFV